MAVARQHVHVVDAGNVQVADVVIGAAHVHVHRHGVGQAGGDGLRPGRHVSVSVHAADVVETASVHAHAHGVRHARLHG